MTGDTNESMDVFVRDIVAGTTKRVSVDSAGNQSDGNSYFPAISDDGRYVVFHSTSSNLVTGDTNAVFDVFVRDMVAGTTTRVSVDSADNEADADSYDAAVSADGRFVTFDSAASNLVTGDTNAAFDVFVRDMVAGTTTAVSVDSTANQANSFSSIPAISADGRYVAFRSDASNLVTGDTNAASDVFVRDRTAGTTTRVSIDSAGNQANGSSSDPAISADGRYVAFDATDPNLVTGDTNDTTDVFVRDTVAGTTTRVSVDSSGHQANNSSSDPAISADGRYVALQSYASNLVTGDTNNRADVIVRANPQPVVTGITPSNLPRRTTTSVTITGSGFVADAFVVIDGHDHTVSNAHLVSPTEITADVSVDADATLSARSVWVELPGTGPGAIAGALNVCAACARVT